MKPPRRVFWLEDVQRFQLSGDVAVFWKGPPVPTFSNPGVAALAALFGVTDEVSEVWPESSRRN